MKNIVFWGTAVLVIGAINFMIVKKERTIASGRTMLLELAPADPRSLMQGDYMVLEYKIAGDIPKLPLESSGRLVVSLDDNNVAKFVRFHKSETLSGGEHLLFYRNRRGLRLGAESFMFQEGRAELYSQARYGELKVDESGQSVLVGLRDEEFRPLGEDRAADSRRRERQ